MHAAISFSRKFWICFAASLICSNTVFRIANRLAWERGAGPAVAVALAVLIFLIGLVYPFIWQRQSRGLDSGPSWGSDSDPSRLSFWRNLLCYGIALDLAMIGIQKLFGLQAHVHIALLDAPFSSLSGEDLSWAYYGRSPAFFNCIGLLQIAGSLLLVFPRTKLLGAFTLLPVLVNIVLTGVFYNFSPGEPLHALILVLGLLYILGEEYDRLRFFFFGSGRLEPANRRSAALESANQRSDAPQPSANLARTALRLSIIYIPLLLILCLFHLPDKDPVQGKYKVSQLWVNNQSIDLNNCADSVVTTVYLDQGRDCVFEDNSHQRLMIGDYWIDHGSANDGSADHRNDSIKIIWHYPASLHDTLLARFQLESAGTIHVDGRMGRDTIRMDWKKVW